MRTSIVTLSNDSWFGRSIGPHQHLQMARMRALENGRYVLRATNNGITAVIDAAAAIVAQAPQFTPTVLDSQFVAMSGATLYARVGNVPVLVLLVFGIVVPLIVRRRG